MNPEDKEELALTIAGKKKKITNKLLLEYGVGLGLRKKQINAAFKRLHELRSDALTLIGSSFLSEDMQEVYINILEQRYVILMNED